MQSSHAATAVGVAFDDPNLIADAGLVLVIALAERINLPQSVAEHVAITDAANSAGANPMAKVMSLLAGWSLVGTPHVGVLAEAEIALVLTPSRYDEA